MSDGEEQHAFFRSEIIRERERRKENSSTWHSESSEPSPPAPVSPPSPFPYYAPPFPTGAKRHRRVGPDTALLSSVDTRSSWARGLDATTRAGSKNRPGEVVGPHESDRFSLSLSPPLLSLSGARTELPLGSCSISNVLGAGGGEEEAATAGSSARARLATLCCSLLRCWAMTIPLPRGGGILKIV